MYFIFYYYKQILNFSSGTEHKFQSAIIGANVAAIQILPLNTNST